MARREGGDTHLGLHTYADYARMHTRGRAREVAEGEPFVGESFHPEGGYWLTRELLYQRRQGDRKRGDHYLHSSYGMRPACMERRSPSNAESLLALTEQKRPRVRFRGRKQSTSSSEGCAACT